MKMKPCAIRDVRNGDWHGDTGGHGLPDLYSPGYAKRLCKKLNTRYGRGSIIYKVFFVTVAVRHLAATVDRSNGSFEVSGVPGRFKSST
jgi:hypothetical protein